MALDIHPKPCLDVAVDHRIRRLFKPVCNDLTEHSNHVSRIETRGHSLKRPHSEIQITTQLAGPALKGGIAVTLQQPRHNHPFEEGLDAVIRDCQTLHALDDLFSTVSCGSLDIRTNVTIVDLLPYVSESIKNINSTILEESFRASKHIMLEKEPSVLLCAGRIRLSSPNYELKGDAFKLESINVGQKFGHTPNKPVEAKIHREGKRGLVTIRRVNGFHPSYAINYHPHVSRLRQLQILIGAETCGMLREDWKEEKWMDELRSSCQDDSQAPSELSTQSPQSQSSCQGSTRPKNPRYLLDYQDLYFRNLVSILRCVRSLVSETRPEVNLFTALYTPLLTCGLSELCNDANLILRQMSRLQTKGWLKPMENAALKQAAIDTLTFTDELQKVAKNSRNAQFVQIFQKGASFLRESVTIWSGRRRKNQLELNSASDAFLNIATNIETLLMELLLEEENNLNALGQEDTLSRGMERMKLEPVLTSAVLPFHA